MAEDAAARLDKGADPQDVLPPANVDLPASLAPYLLVFDERGRLLASSVTVDGRQPDYPAGVFTNVPRGGAEKVTWQAASGERSATVAVRYDHGYVVAGRSLREVEERETNAELIAAAGWVATLAAAAVAALLAAFIPGRK